MNKFPKGWGALVEQTKSDLFRIAPEISIVEISVGQFGRLQFYYGDKHLTSQQKSAVDGRIARAEQVAWETCVVCGQYGRPAYIASPPQARVYCTSHKPTEWNELSG